jgi:hypothetical protein
MDMLPILLACAVCGAAEKTFPVVQEMRGYRVTAPVLLASVGVDF